MVARNVFKPRFGKGDALELVKEYNVAGDKGSMEAGRAIRQGDFATEHFRRIVEWKTRGRGKSRLRRNKEEEIKDALRLATMAREPRSAIAVLTGLFGVNVPVASAIMTAIYPKKYTILDFRALAALGVRGSDRSLPLYLSYLEYCTRLARRWHMHLRDLDHALWQWSKSH